jgi:hypothetical protein
MIISLYMRFCTGSTQRDWPDAHDFFKLDLFNRSTSLDLLDILVVVPRATRPE